jgi:cytochrome c oxidase subunit 2
MKQSIGIVIVLMLMLAGCSNESATGTERGEELYKTGGASAIPCATCHSLDGSQLVGPSFEGLGERASSAVPDMSAEDYLRQSIKDPAAHLVDGYQDTMYKQYGDVLSENDIEALVAFLMIQ